MARMGDSLEMEAQRDDAALARIRADLGTTLAVEASAGTGKTFALVERVVALLRGGVPMRQIAVMTFLRAAAEELRMRVAEALAKESDAWARAAEADLPEAFLGTIHAFAERLIREGAAEVGQDPGIRVLSSVEEELMRLHAFHAFLEERAMEDPGPLTEARLIGSSLTVEYLYPMVHGLEEEAAVPEAPSESELIALGRVLVERTEKVGALRDSVAGSVTDRSDLLWGMVERVAFLSGPLRELLGEGRLADLAAVELPSPGNRGQKGHYPSRDTLNALRAAVKGTVEARDALRERLGAARASRLLLWLKPFPVTFRAMREREGRVTEDELLDRALALLRVPSARERARERYRYVLVDEFQDTDPRQLDILRCLGATEDGRMFAVGDPKQAIYGFRGADVDTYSAWVDTVPKEFRLCLTVSRRSRPGVVDAVNRIAGPLFAKAGHDYLALGPLVDSSTAGAGLVLGREGEGETEAGGEGQVEDGLLAPVSVLRGDLEPRAEAAREREARAVASLLAQAIGHWRVRRRDGSTGLLAASDVAILARRRASFPVLLDALLERGIGASATRDRSLWSHAAARDLLTILGALVRPCSATEVVAALRSGLIGWSDQDLLDFRAWGGTFDLLFGLDGLDESFARKGSDRLRVFAALGECATLASLTVSERLWRLEESLDLPGAAALLDGERGVRTLRQAREALVALATDGSGVARSLEDVLRAARDLGTLAEDRATEAIANAARTDVERPEVRLLTVHEAKGLEFPVVILCDLDHTSHPTPTGVRTFVASTGQRTYALGFPVERWGEGGRARTLGSDEADAYEAKRQRDEMIRLLYVALTRARDAIVLCDFPARHAHRSAKSASFAGLLLAGTEPTEGGVGTGRPEVEGAEPTGSLAAALSRLGVEAIVQEDRDLPEGSGRPAIDADAFAQRPAWRDEGVRLRRAMAGRIRILRPSMLSERSAMEHGDARLPSGEGAASVREGRGPLHPDGAAPAAGGDFAGSESAGGWARSERARRIGRAVHAVLAECLRLPPPSRPLLDLCLEATLAEGLDPGPRGRGTGAEEDAGSKAAEGSPDVAEIFSLAHRGLTSPLLQTALGTPNRQVEAEVFARDRRLLILGRADLVFEEADGGGLTVVDFKTDQVPEEWSEGDLRAYAVRHGYAGQVEAYRRAMQLATGRTVDHAFVLFLRPGRAVEFLPGTIGSWADAESLLTGPQQPA